MFLLHACLTNLTSTVLIGILFLIYSVPEFVLMQPNVYALAESNVALNCTPSDSRAPVFWSLDYG